MDFAEQIEDLRRVRDGFGNEYSNDEILYMGLAHFPGPVSNEQLADEADAQLAELLEPLPDVFDLAGNPSYSS